MSDAEFKAECARLAREAANIAKQVLLSLQQLMRVLSNQINLPASWKTALATSGSRTFEDYLERQDRASEQRTGRQSAAAQQSEVRQTAGNLEFVVMGSNLKPVTEGQATEADLYRKMARNELPKGTLLVRTSGSEDYIPWSEFIGATTDKTV